MRCLDSRTRPHQPLSKPIMSLRPVHDTLAPHINHHWLIRDFPRDPEFGSSHWGLKPSFVLSVSMALGTLTWRHGCHCSRARIDRISA
ncbi:hypothetical protein AUEXF2481DRAFT_644008 [Aureobasidium subglaciale EXF-2481]|uniref:Uncharacterized protein n=1 Tax=Aureobasidium subglaciale (strain EXF-2481) TaxID=1043005 RepID=A0A074YR40_AURSE|nr:uncharacterized protein AUEXF2481DRAFT_644008 [Aureobasidium subglaciale EXF-2481]KEQ96572.1 hypothetical protein AUEXF2481DRAFT_644008 [Aureobasidium subglaciale EXF-2481]